MDGSWVDRREDEWAPGQGWAVRDDGQQQYGRQGTNVQSVITHRQHSSSQHMSMSVATIVETVHAGLRGVYGCFHNHAYLVNELEAISVISVMP
jgi:hypothetical protein